MNPKHERACLQAAIDYLGLTPKEAADWAPKLDSPRMRASARAATAVLRERIHDLHIEPEHDAEVFELTRELRAKYLPADPLNAAPPVPAAPDDKIAAGVTLPHD